MSGLTWGMAWGSVVVVVKYIPNAAATVYLEVY